MKKLEMMEKNKLNCNSFTVYDCDGLTQNELLCQFFNRLNECTNIANESIAILEWLKEIGLPAEVLKQLEIWLNDGTLENVINEGIFTELNDKLNLLSSRIVSVKDFGAKGDGITDDKQSILNAMRYLKDKTIKVLHFEANKTYLISEGLEMNVSGITLEGNNSTIITNNDNIGNMLINGVLNEEYYEYNGYSDITINNLNFRGKLNGTTNCAIAFGHARNIKINNCNFYDINSHCLDLGGVDGVVIEGCKFLGSPTSEHTLKECIQLDYASTPGFTVFGAFDKSVTKNVTVNRCEFLESENYPCWERGIGGHTSFIENVFENIVITENVFNVNTCAVSFEGTNVNNLVVENNIINVAKVGGSSIMITADKRYCKSSKMFVINNNECTSDYGINYNSDVVCSDMYINNNKFNCKNTSIRIEGKNSLSYVVVNGNVINCLENGIGVKMLTCKNVNILDNFIVNSNYSSIDLFECDVINVFNNSIKNGLKYGIITDKTSNLIVQGNNILEMSSSAIVINYSTSGLYESVYIVDNQINNIGFFGDVGLQNRGIQVSNSLVVVKNNCIIDINLDNNYIFIDNSAKGIVCDNLLLSNNEIPVLNVPEHVTIVNNNIVKI